MIYVIPDTQSKEGVKNPLIAVAYHICSIKPDYVIHGGDHWDMPSLSYYDRGKKSHRVRSYLRDIKSGNKAMEEFWEIIFSLWPKAKKECEWIILRGNHEERRARALEYGSDELIELMEQFDFDYSHWDEVVPFLKIIKIKGINFCHYFQNNNSDRPITTARQLLLKKHKSCVAFHQQGFDYAEQLSDSKNIQAFIIGSCYYHKESYKPQSNHHWRGTVVLKNLNNKHFDFDRHSLKSLEEEYVKS